MEDGHGHGVALGVEDGVLGEGPREGQLLSQGRERARARVDAHKREGSVPARGHPPEAPREVGAAHVGHRGVAPVGTYVKTFGTEAHFQLVGHAVRPVGIEGDARQMAAAVEHEPEASPAPGDVQREEVMPAGMPIEHRELLGHLDGGAEARERGRGGVGHAVEGHVRVVEVDGQDVFGRVEGHSVDAVVAGAVGAHFGLREGRRGPEAPVGQEAHHEELLAGGLGARHEEGAGGVDGGGAEVEPDGGVLEDAGAGLVGEVENEDAASVGEVGEGVIEFVDAGGGRRARLGHVGHGEAGVAREDVRPAHHRVAGRGRTHDGGPGGGLPDEREGVLVAGGAVEHAVGVRVGHHVGVREGEELAGEVGARLRCERGGRALASHEERRGEGEVDQ